MTEWFQRKAGDEFSIHHEDESVVLIGDQTPDWVKLPPELGGATLRIASSFRMECPMCEDGAPVRHFACSDGYGVAECSRHGFVWYRRKTS